MQTDTLDFPLRHLSVRVPWHDAGWAGSVCIAPQLNGACAKLKRISDHKNEDQERLIAGRSLEELPNEQWPCCVEERATFMAPFEMEQIKRHALAERNPKVYGHFQPTHQRYPAYSAGIVPFRWMILENMRTYGELYDLDVDEEREPDLGYKQDWVHEIGNQTALLEGFAAHLREEDSLCFFYAKHVPFVEGTGRILIGVGQVKKIGPLTEYKKKAEGMSGMLWERPVQHSIRPKGHHGFLLPYFEVIRRSQDDPSLEAERYAAGAPDEHWDEFSYGSELVTHDGAIAALLSVDTTLNRMESELGISSTWQRQWLHDHLVRLWKVRGPYPGLGAVLAAFGLSRGVFVAHALQQRAGENEDPWPLVNSAFDAPDSVLPKTLHNDLKELSPTWRKLTKERKAFLRLLSRFELSKDQAVALYEHESRHARDWPATDREILQNPYVIYEISRHHPEGIELLTVDRGVFPEDVVRVKHKMELPSRLDSAIDLRRVRAFTIAALEEAALNGHTLLPRSLLVEAILSRPASPACSVTGDIVSTRAVDMVPHVMSIEMDGDLALQLDRYKTIGDIVRKQIKGRIAGQRHTVNHDWLALLEEKFGPATEAEEKRARAEKVAALEELAEARLSVLAGSAGTGKTSLLGILCAQPEIRKDGLLLLAPAGKARVRMQELAGGAGSRAFTLAQFLNQHGRYDTEAARYILSDRPKATGFGTVVVDESSMLTEDMTGALFDALQGVKRFIFVGDPAHCRRLELGAHSWTSWPSCDQPITSRAFRALQPAMRS